MRLLIAIEWSEGSSECSAGVVARQDILCREHLHPQISSCLGGYTHRPRQYKSREQTAFFCEVYESLLDLFFILLLHSPLNFTRLSNDTIFPALIEST